MDGSATRSSAAMPRMAQEYASFAQRRSGPRVAASWLPGPGVATAALTAGLTVVWLAGKANFRRGLSRRGGAAGEGWVEARA